MVVELEHVLEMILENIVSLSIVLFEFMGVGIIIWSGVRGFLKWLRHSDDTKIYLARGLVLGLEFKMGSEILRTVIVRDWMEIVIVGGIIALRAALAFLIHWEIRQEEKTIELKNQE